jgi:hypothetical protein
MEDGEAMTLLGWFIAVVVVAFVFCLGFAAGAVWHSLPWED